MDLSAWKKTDSQLVSTMDITFYRGLFQQVDFSVPSKQFDKDSSLCLCLCHFMQKGMKQNLARLNYKIN